LLRLNSSNIGTIGIHLCYQLERACLK
jgi:hypothetical protein